MSISKIKIINSVVQIILKYAKPERIYLFGSQTTGEADDTSDIDIAYDDNHFNEEYLIQEEIDKIDTLIKIDVKNLKNTDDRFKNRVKSTGKVLYSANIHLRAEDGLYNFSKALDRYIEVTEGEERFKTEGFADVYVDIVVKRFEFTYEMAWKAIKRYLNYLGIEAKNPRSVFKEAFSQEIISDESIWLNMIEQRNLSSHIYDQDEINEILAKKDEYKLAFEDLRDYLEKSLKQNK